MREPETTERLNRSSQPAPASLEAVAEAIPHIVWLADASGSMDYVNERGTEYTGLPPQANYWWRWVELVHPDDADRARLGWEHATRTGTPFTLIYRIRRRDGEYRWHAFRALPVRDADGRVLRWIGTADELDGAACDDQGLVQRQAAELRAMIAGDDPPARRKPSGAPSPSDGEPTTGSSDGHSPTVSLTPRELAVAQLLAGGFTNAEMANLLGFSLRTIEATRARLRQRFEVRTRAEVVRVARELGLVV